MLTPSTLLKHYKRKDVQDAMVEHARDREVAPRYNDKFGSRPDMLQYGNDVFEFARNGATSFHCSEERWKNPLQLSGDMKPHDMQNLRSGWDLVIDVDCKNWEYSKLIAHGVVDIIKNFGISSVTAKFSGNKGFHIGVPFEAFPQKIHGKDIQTLFPEGPRRIALYIIHILEEKFSEMLKQQNIKQLADSLHLKPEELLVRACTRCSTPKIAEKIFEFICPSCESTSTSNENVSYKSCEKCGKLMTKTQASEKCKSCGNTTFKTKLDTERILEIDTLLISSRHLYRAPYSLHEKSGLVSIPIDPNEILEFSKDQADPEKITFNYQFLDRNVPSNETSHLFIQAFDYTLPKQEEEKTFSSDIDIPETAIPEQHFPQCIKKLSLGLGDGKKRALFIIINFLRSVGWSPEQVEKYVYDWNKRNPEPLKENYLIGQLRYIKLRKPILPPNCANMAYYQSLACKCDDSICSRFKNPVNTAKINLKRATLPEKPKRGRKKKEEGQNTPNPNGPNEQTENNPNQNEQTEQIENKTNKPPKKNEVEF